MFIKFNESNKPLAAAIGRALLEYGQGAANDTQPTPHPGGQEPAPSGNKLLNFEDEMSREYPTQSGGTNSDLPSQGQGGSGGTKMPTHVDGNARLDEHMVPFNSALCANAEIPFYASGKTKGQWKRKKGIGQAEYDAWYCDAITNVVSSGQGNDHAELDTSAAFSGQEQPKPESLTFADAGAFMGWVSEQQAANLLTQDDIDGSYKMAGVLVQDLFNAEKAPETIKEVYKVLSRIAAGEA